MKRILLIALCLACIVGTASAYGLYLDCPESIQVGLPLKCSIDSNLPAGNTFDLVLYLLPVHRNRDQEPDGDDPGGP